MRFKFRYSSYTIMFTWDRSQMDPTLSWNGPFLFTRHRSAYQRQATRDRSVMVTFTGLYTKWDSFTPEKYKVNLIRTLTFRCFRICSSPSLLRSSLNELRKLLLQNGYPIGVVNYNINDVLNRQQNRPKNPTTTVSKKETILVLPYLGVQSKVMAMVRY